MKILNKINSLKMSIRKFLQDYKHCGKEWILLKACYNGRMDVVLYMINKLPQWKIDTWLIYDLRSKSTPVEFNYLYDYGLHMACYGGHMDIALFMMEQGPVNLTYGLINACDGGHKDLTLLMIEKGADINRCTLELTEFDIDYLSNKITQFGKYEELVTLYKTKRQLADNVLKELNMRDVNTVIYSY